MIFFLLYLPSLEGKEFHMQERYASYPDTKWLVLYVSNKSWSLTIMDAQKWKILNYCTILLLWTKTAKVQQDWLIGDMDADRKGACTYQALICFFSLISLISLILYLSDKTNTSHQTLRINAQHAWKLVSNMGLMLKR